VAAMNGIVAVLLALPVVRLFAICYLLLVAKMVAVGFATSFLRIRRRVFATPEDYALRGGTPPSVPDEDIERIRRAHRNDLENILPFFAVGFFYALTGPPMIAARIYFIGFLVARVLHSIFYVRGMQPWRTLAFTVGMVLMLGLLVNTLVRIASV
jgi:uncharacterized MAPEG superfamily protein